MRITPIACLALLLTACGGAPAERAETAETPAPPAADAPAADAPAAPAAESPAADEGGPRPGSHGCGACRVVVCVEPTGGRRRVERVDLELNLETPDPSPAYQKAVLELKPPTGIGEGLKLDPKGWAPGKTITVSAKGTGFDPTEEDDGWKGATARLSLVWKAGGVLKGATVDVEAVEVDRCGK